MEQDVAERLRRIEAMTVNQDDIGLGVCPQSDLGALVVDGHPAFPDDLFAGSPRTMTRLGHQLLEL
jgi:hypothetical protein